MVRVQRWAVGAIMQDQTWEEELSKRVFNTYEAAMHYVTELNESRHYSLVFVQDNDFFKET